MLVLTGIATKEELCKHDVLSELPNYFLDSFADFSKIYEELESGHEEIN